MIRQNRKDGGREWGLMGEDRDGRNRLRVLLPTSPENTRTKQTKYCGDHLTREQEEGTD